MHPDHASHFTFSDVPLVPPLLKMVAGDQVDNLRNKHSSADGQGGPPQGGNGRGHEQSGALQGTERLATVMAAVREGREPGL